MNSSTMAHEVTKSSVEDSTMGLLGRVLTVGIGAAIVITAVVIVVCIACPGCPLNLVFMNDSEKKKRRLRAEKNKLFGLESSQQQYYGKERTQHALTPTLGSRTPRAKSPLAYADGRNSIQSDASITTVSSNERNSLLDNVNKRDSTYSSMSESSDKTSPTNSVLSSQDSSSVSPLFSPSSSDFLESRGQISFALQFLLTNEERSTGKLIINVLEARDLPGRFYMAGACDPFVKVVVWRERRSFRNSFKGGADKGSNPLQVFRTRVVRHTTKPVFNASFVMETNRSDVKELVVKLVAMDSDKWVSPTTLGEVVQPLRDIRDVANKPERTSLSYFLAPAKIDFGQILVGLSFLPTAQRLSVSVMKASHLRYSNVVVDVEDFNPYVRALLLGPSGRVLRKKKTTFRLSTDKPTWNETLIFDMPQSLIENVTFIMAVCSRPQPASLPDNTQLSMVSAATAIQQALMLAQPSSPATTPGHSPPTTPNALRSRSVSPESSNSHRRADQFVGKVVLGCGVRREQERRHWRAVLASPRKVLTQWHTLV